MVQPRPGHRGNVIAPELGFSQPGMLITCNDSTRDAWRCGALAIPIGGGNQLRHVLATQTVWLKKPKTFRITIDGALPPAVTAKDVILSIIAQIGVGGGPATPWNTPAPPSARCRWKDG